MKRQRGRGRKPGGGGGGGGHNHGNRSLESNGPDVKIRGTAAQIYEKYSQYARDAQSGGDRVRYENFLQHAEHYYRVMAATMPRERLLAQQNGEGGLQQPYPPTGEGLNVQHSDDMVPAGDPGEAVKALDDMTAVDEEGEEDTELEADSGEPDREEAESPGQDQQADLSQESGGRGRRRRGRRRHNEGDRSVGGATDKEARSALDNLARRQGALTGG